MKMVGVALELTGIMIGAIFLGQWLDSHFQMKGIFTAVLVILGFAGWVIHLVRALKK